MKHDLHIYIMQSSKDFLNRIDAVFKYILMKRLELRASGETRTRKFSVEMTYLSPIFKVKYVH